MHPTRIAMGDGPLAPYLGAVVMNTVLAVAFQLLFMAINRKLAMFPGLGVYLFLCMFLPQVQFSVRIMWSEHRQWHHVVTGAVVLLGHLAFFGGVIRLWRSHAYLGTRRWRALFDCYLSQKKEFFIVVELSTQLLFAMSTAYMTSDRSTCTSQAVACAAISCLHFIAVVVFRPYDPFQTCGYVIVDVLTTVASVFAALGSFGTEDIVSMVAVSLMVFVVMIGNVRTVVVLCEQTFLVGAGDDAEKPREGETDLVIGTDTEHSGEYILSPLVPHSRSEVTEMVTKTEAPLQEPLFDGRCQKDRKFSL